MISIQLVIACCVLWPLLLDLTCLSQSTNVSTLMRSSSVMGRVTGALSVNRFDGTVYVGDWTTNIVYSFTGANRPLPTIALTRSQDLCYQVSGTAVAFNGSAYALCWTDNQNSYNIFELPSGRLRYRLVIGLSNNFDYDNFAFDPDGNFWMANTGSYTPRVTKFNGTNGNIIVNLGGFARVVRFLAVDIHGNMYTNELANSNVYVLRFTPAGVAVKQFPLASTASVRGIAVDSRFYVYVNDATTRTIIKFNSNAEVMSYYSTGAIVCNNIAVRDDNVIYCLYPAGNYVIILSNALAEPVSMKVGPGLTGPRDVAYANTLSDGARLVVCDAGNGRVLIVNMNGNPTATLSSATLNGSKIITPYAAVMDSSSDAVFIADSAKRSVIYYRRNTSVTEEYNFITAFTTSPPVNPTAMAIDTTGRLYVVDNGTNHLYTLHPKQQTQLMLLSAFDPSIRINGLTIDNFGRFYLSDIGRNQIIVYNNVSAFEDGFVAQRISAVQPTFLAVRGGSYLYVSNLTHITQITMNHASDMIKRMSAPLLSYQNSPNGITVDPNGQLYAVNTVGDASLIRFDWTPPPSLASACHAQVSFGDQRSVFYDLSALSTSDYSLGTNIKLRLCGAASNCLLVSPASQYPPMMCQTSDPTRGILIASSSSTLWGGIPQWSYIDGNASRGLMMNVSNGESFSCDDSMTSRTVSISFPCANTQSSPQIVFDENCAYRLTWPTPLSCPSKGRPAQPQCFTAGYNFTALSASDVSTVVGSRENANTTYAIRMCGSVGRQSICGADLPSSCMACASVPGSSPVCLAYYDMTRTIEWSAVDAADGVEFRIANGDRCLGRGIITGQIRCALNESGIASLQVDDRDECNVRFSFRTHSACHSDAPSSSSAVIISASSSDSSSHSSSLSSSMSSSLSSSRSSSASSSASSSKSSSVSSSASSSASSSVSSSQRSSSVMSISSLQPALFSSLPPSSSTSFLVSSITSVSPSSSVSSSSSSSPSSSSMHNDDIVSSVFETLSSSSSPQPSSSSSLPSSSASLSSSSSSSSSSSLLSTSSPPSSSSSSSSSLSNQSQIPETEADGSALMIVLIVLVIILTGLILFCALFICYYYYYYYLSRRRPFFKQNDRNENGIALPSIIPFQRTVSQMHSEPLLNYNQ